MDIQKLKADGVYVVTFPRDATQEQMADVASQIYDATEDLPNIHVVLVNEPIHMGEMNEEQLVTFSHFVTAYQTQRLRFELTVIADVKCYTCNGEVDWCLMGADMTCAVYTCNQCVNNFLGHGVTVYNMHTLREHATPSREN